MTNQASSGGTAAPARSAIRYEPDETPPALLSIGLGLQSAVVQVAGVILTPVIVVRAAGLDGDPYLNWAVFAAVAVSGVSTILQAVRVGRFGAGHILTMGTSGAFIAVAVAALRAGGPGLLASLVVASSLCQFLLAFRLSTLRRIVTPTVAGTVIMLIAVAVMPIVFPMLSDVPEGVPGSAAAAVAGVTLLTIVAIALRGRGALRVWAPIAGVAAGSATAAGLGFFEVGPAREAAWVGIPTNAWPGFTFDLGPAFWSFLPAFVFVTLVGAIETIGDSIAIQRVSRRKPRAPDYRVVEGAVAADGFGNLLSGLGATVPNTTYSSTIAVTELTGVASRRIGVWIGVSFLALAFMPKASALFLAIPNPVVGAFALATLALLFTVGMRMVVQDGLTTRKAVIVGISFWLGAGFQDRAIFAGALGPLAPLLENGMTAGGLAAVLLMLFVNLTGPRPRRLDTALGVAAGERIATFLAGLAAERGWDRRSSHRLLSAGEEALLSLAGDAPKGPGTRDPSPEPALAAEPSLSAEPDRPPAPDPRPERERPEEPERRLRLTARVSRRAAELEFVAAAGQENLEDRLALLPEHAETPEAGEISLRLLRHYASAVRHQKYYGVDIVTIRVEA